MRPRVSRAAADWVPVCIYACWHWESFHLQLHQMYMTACKTAAAATKYYATGQRLIPPLLFPVSFSVPSPSRLLYSSSGIFLFLIRWRVWEVIGLLAKDRTHTSRHITTLTSALELKVNTKTKTHRRFKSNLSFSPFPSVLLLLITRSWIQVLNWEVISE